ncbi:DASH complex subunit ASK1 [Aspergillus candidus]|uniref:DASH complex subunit ASK1 n=1 Tax=Aspergillus candidus TaxID=41067 RepID=A0A2I2F760_ASPCN|nr:hypothetical protein BDW47DRAFT_108632 [Aspergillus candidus]PLB36454.1 hypothetical protein BDW47DRAFT_108632 [Aspergillus candidus]
MSRPSSISQRPLTLTEELEKLEQSITLTLQEIDHNFSQAHRIVTTSILPVVEQYAESSRDVWEGAKFWKQFFEASANVSLSGYEERPNEDDSMRDQTVTEDDESANVTQTTEHTSYEGASSEQLDAHHRGDDLDLTALSLSSHSTPRHPQQERLSHDNDTTVTSSIARPSPYETLKHEVDDFDSPLPPSRQYGAEEEYDLDHDDLPTTPGRGPPRYGGPSDTPTMSSSPFVPPVSHDAHKSSDPVMHRLQDKTYRVQATPIGKSYGNRPKFTVTPKQTTSSSSRFNFDSPLSSPELEAPQLNAEIFSPVKGDPETPNISRKRRPSGPRSRTTPKPGISVLTPAKGKKPVWDSDDDFDDDDMDFVGGPSPPKTMQFHIPQSRLMKTPAKEASKRIVEDLLFTAGANDTTDDLPEDHSPSVIRRAERLEDETF